METPQGVQTENPVTISIVGTGSGTGGGMAPTQNGTVAVTPGYQPNLLIQVITPAVAIAVRFGHSFFQSFLGLITAAGIGVKIFGGADFEQVIVSSAWASLIVAGIGFVKDIVTVFGRLEGKYPLLSGSI